MFWFNIRMFLYSLRKRIVFQFFTRLHAKTMSTGFIHHSAPNLSCNECRQPTADMRQYSIGGDRWVQEGVCDEHGKSFMIIDTQALLNDLYIFDRALLDARDTVISLSHEELALHLERAAKRRTIQYQRIRAWSACVVAFLTLCLVILAIFGGSITIVI